MFCWGMNDDGSFAVGVGSHQPCGDQYLAPIIALGVEMLPAGGLSAAALLNDSGTKTAVLPEVSTEPPLVVMEPTVVGNGLLAESSPHPPAPPPESTRC